MCGGTGSEPGSKPLRCPECNGTGQVKRVQQSIFGRFVNIATCGRCRGEGSVIAQPCPTCRGTAYVRQQRHVNVDVPPGVDNEYQIRVAGQGDVGRWGGSPGDLYVSLAVEAHPVFQRKGDDIVYNLPINIAQAALGDEVEVPTLEGRHTLRIPQGVQSGKIFRLKGKGVPHVKGGGRGDQIIMVSVLTPTNLDENQRRLLRELYKTLPKPAQHFDEAEVGEKESVLHRIFRNNRQ